MLIQCLCVWLAGSMGLRRMTCFIISICNWKEKENNKKKNMKKKKLKNAHLNHKLIFQIQGIRILKGVLLLGMVPKR